MPKETGRTQLIRATVLEIRKENPDADERLLREAVFGKLAEKGADEKETQRLKESIRRIVSQMQASGDKAPKKATTRKKRDRNPKGGEETAVAATPSDALQPTPENDAGSEPTPAAPVTETTEQPVPKTKTPAPETPEETPREGKAEEKRPTVRMPKAKQMNDFLSGALHEDAPEKEETLVGQAVAFFGVSGEQVNGVRGLVIQCLMEQKKSGAVVFDRATGYRKANSEEVKTDVPAESKPAEPKPEPTVAKPVPQVQVKRVSGRTKTEARTLRKTELESRKGTARLTLNENRFAEQINRAGGAFFTEFVARLFEGWFRSRGLTVCGRYVVDGSDDKGVDVILHTVDELGLRDVVFLQAKTRSSGQVTLKELREFYGVMAAEKADKGLFVTTSTFTTDAVTFVRAHPDFAAVDKYALFALASRLKIGLIENEGGALVPDPDLFG